MNKKILGLCALALLCASCANSYIEIIKIKTDKMTFASRFAKTPDPRALNPPKGEKLYVNWSLPLQFSPGQYRIKIDVIYKDLTREVLVYPLKRRAGTKIIEMLGEEFKEKKGFLSYKAEVITLDDKVVSDYTHRMWVDIILPCNLQ